MLAYLCGPIEFAPDRGKLWRRKLTPFLHNDLGHRVYDPAEDEKKNLSEEEAAHFREWKETDVERFRRVVRKIIQYDLDIVENKADYVICSLAGDGAALASGGTSSELTFAHRRGIPVYLMTDAPTAEISGWILACVEIARQRVQIFKPVIDQRYAHTDIVSHSGFELPSEVVTNAVEVFEKVQPRTEVVGIDEGQFLGEGLVDICMRMADAGKGVIVTGLDTDYLGRPFDPMPRLLAVAEEITKLLAICVQCGNPAVHTQRLVASEDLIVVGAAGMYEPRCRRCFEPHLAHDRVEANKSASPVSALPTPRPVTSSD